MIYSEAFKRVRECATELLSDEDKATFSEYLHSVLYHLSSAHEAAQRSSSAIYSAAINGNIALGHDGRDVYVFGFDLNGLVTHGDVAIREAASVIDTALILTNHVLGFGMDQRRLRWNDSQASRSLKTQLKRLSRNQGQPLVGAIERVWDSIGFELLQEYRNWITHRGAPRVSSEVQLPGPIPIPEDIRTEADVESRDWQLKTYILTAVPRAVGVYCFPFYPPVMMIYSADVDHAEEDMTLPGGIHIGRGASVSVRDARVASGSLLENEASFRARNQVTPEARRVTVAGEELAVYNAGDYVQAVNIVARFAEQVVSGDWDQELAALWKRRQR